MADRRWINCPLCGSTDTRAEREDEGWLIYCVNTACPSNVSPELEPKAEATSFREIVERAENIEWLREELLRRLAPSENAPSDSGVRDDG